MGEGLYTVEDDKVFFEELFERAGICSSEGSNPGFVWEQVKKCCFDQLSNCYNELSIQKRLDIELIKENESIKEFIKKYVLF